MNTTSDEAQLRELIASQQRGILAKNCDQIMADYAPGVIVFDAIPPFQVRGAAAFRKSWEGCLPYFPESYGIETRDMQLTVGSDMAFGHWLVRFTGAPDHPATRQWLRTTAVYQKKQDRWQIVHEHCSVPFDPYTSQAILTLEPDATPES